MCWGVGSRAEKTIGEKGDDLSVWIWGSLVRTTGGIGVGSDMQGI